MIEGTGVTLVDGKFLSPAKFKIGGQELAIVHRKQHGSINKVIVPMTVIK